MSVPPATPTPRTNVLEVLPELANRSTVTVRLHPRRGEVAELGASKLGGLFLWPKSEPWPCCDETGPAEWADDDKSSADAPHPPLVPVLQLTARDFPELSFRPGTDLLQIFWCPTNHTTTFVAKPFVVWRRAEDVVDPLHAMPTATEPDGDYVPIPCVLYPERVQEYPHVFDLGEPLLKQLDEWVLPPAMAEFFGDSLTMYEWALSVCPSSKIGGYVYWVQASELPTCECGRVMTHLLTLSDSEYDGGTFPRWMPLAERPLWDGDYKDRLAVQCAPHWGLGGGRLFLFVCNACDHRPTKAVYQR